MRTTLSNFLLCATVALTCAHVSPFPESLNINETAPRQNVEGENEKIKAFWKWFAQNESSAGKSTPERNQFISDAVEKLKAISPDLTLEVEHLPEGTIRAAISADDVEKEFPYVEDVFRQAPIISGWKFVAFRQPGKLKGASIEYSGLKLEADKMSILPIEDEHGFHLIVYFPDYSDDKRNHFINASYLLLDDALGEYNVAKGIRTIDFQRLPPSGQRKGIVPFTQLPKVFAEYQAKRSH